MSGRAGEVRGLEAYTAQELAAGASWPAIERYLTLLKRPAETPLHLLRLKRHELWTRASLETFFGRPDDLAIAENACAFWSAAADGLIDEAWRLSGCAEAGFGLLALGKLGAGELNLSSDVDLIVVRPDNIEPDMKLFRRFQAALSESDEFGFCLRTDFMLRPGGKASAAIPSLSDFEYHYGYHGEMWERLAYVRMRLLQGPRALGDAIMSFIAKFSYRRHLDYTLIDELRSLRSRIRTEKFETRPDSFHLKLGEGGIRELELFVHAMQVMHGGRNPSLRTRSTGAAIDRIAAMKLLSDEDCRRLRSAYWYLRTLENRLQGYDDQQTYLLDLKRGHPALPFEFRERLARAREDILEISASFFSPDKPAARGSDGGVPAVLEEQQQWLLTKGFSRDSAEETWPALLAATALSRRSEADERQRLDFLAGFVAKLSEIKLDRDLGLSLLLDFVRAVRAKASFFTLLNRETRVRDELAMLFSISPYLGSLLASRPELIDEFIFRKQAPPSDDFGALLEELAERRLLAELIAANHFLGDRDLRKMTFNLTANADAICETLLGRLRDEFATPNVGLVALGKWGGRELGLRSDLDFVFVTEASPSIEEQKIAKRFLSRITEPHRGGSIYAVDMRLRPSGGSGPIIVAKDELARYLRESAAAWERQAYLRARSLDDPDFQPGKVGAERGLSPDDKKELGMIREKLFSCGSEAELDLKLTFGGLADIEFTSQIALLSRGEFSLDPSTSGMIQCLEGVDERWSEVGPRLRSGYESLRIIEQLYQLTTSQSGSKLRLKSDEFKRLALVLDMSGDELEERVRSLFATIVRDLRDLNELAR